MVLKGLLHAEKISEDAKLRLAKLIEKGVDQAVKLNNVAWMTIADAIEKASCHKLKLTLESDKLTKEGEQLVKKEIIEPNIKSLQSDDTNWLNLKMKYAQEQLGETLAIDSDELLKETTFLLTAGHDTTAKHFMFSFLLVCKHPNVLKKIIDEVRSLQKEPKDWTDEDFKKMTYLDLITLESLRLCPPLPIQKTKVAKEFTTRDGITLKPGDQVFANIGATHRLPNIYDKPDEFIPERFADQKFDQFVFQTVDPNSPYYFAWMPFGSGIRSCPGRRAAMQEVKIALAYFAYFVNMKLEKDWSLHEVMTTFGAKPHTDSPIELVVTPDVTRNLADEKNDAAQITLGMK
jgi:cytochrome P450